MSLDESIHLGTRTSTSDVVHVTWNVIYETATGGHMREAYQLVACTWRKGDVNWEHSRTPPLYGRRYITTHDLRGDPTMRPTCIECLMHLEAALEMSTYQR